MTGTMTGTIVILVLRHYIKFIQMLLQTCSGNTAAWH